MLLGTPPRQTARATCCGAETPIVPSPSPKASSMLSKPSRNHRRNVSFSDIDEAKASGLLTDILQDSDARLGGCSIGRGFQRAAKQHLSDMKRRQLAAFIDEDIDEANIEDDEYPVAAEPFYIVDIGIVVSQVYQWRKFFPRIEPFYAVKCNPDPYIVRTLGALGCNFDCASRGEIDLVQQMCKSLPNQPDIIFANPCKAPAHIIHALRNDVTLMTFDNDVEIHKCAKLSRPNKQIRLILRIITDDRGSQCRLSSKFGAPRHKWRHLLATAQKHNIPVVGVSFHVGSGCRDASRYEMAVKDARELFDIASEYGHDMSILDIGGGFPGETHSIWNPMVELEGEEEEDTKEAKEGSSAGSDNEAEEEAEGQRFMFFTEIAEVVAPIIDELFPPESGVRVIAEPGRFMVAASSTLCCSIISARSNFLKTDEEPEAVNDEEMCDRLKLSYKPEGDYNNHRRQLSSGEGPSSTHARSRSLSINQVSDFNYADDIVLQTIQDELMDYSRLYASQQIVQHGVDGYNDALDMFKEGFETATNLLGPPDEEQKLLEPRHTMEGMSFALLANDDEDGDDNNNNGNNADASTGGQGGGEGELPAPLITLAAAGEAAVSGVVMQAVADSAALQDDYAYYMNDGVYGAFNNIMFDHAQCRPRVLRTKEQDQQQATRNLYTSTVFGPTCDSIDVVARSVLLPELKVGDWLYFENMGAYTSAAASCFNGFSQSEKVYVCSVQPEYFEAMIAGPPDAGAEEDAVEEKKIDR